MKNATSFARFGQPKAPGRSTLDRDADHNGTCIRVNFRAWHGANSLENWPHPISSDLIRMVRAFPVGWGFESFRARSASPAPDGAVRLFHG